MECIPGDTHLLRQDIKKAKNLQRQTLERNIIGRQVLLMVYHFFAMNEKDKAMTDIARLHSVTFTSGCIQQFIYKLDETLSLVKTQQGEDDLVNLFLLQFDLLPQKTHGFYV